MREITKMMIANYQIKKADFMGYDIKNKRDLSFHHLIVPHRYCKELGLGEGYYFWNGAILVQDTAHEYLHLIEREDKEIFYRITSEMIDENIKGKIDRDNLLKIRDLLLYFEKYNIDKFNSRGKKLIKKDYLINRFSALD